MESLAQSPGRRWGIYTRISVDKGEAQYIKSPSDVGTGKAQDDKAPLSEIIEVLKRGFSPRIIDAYVLGSAGSTPVTGDELAARLGLPDTWAYFSVADASGEHPEPDRSGQPGGGAPGSASPPAQGSGGTPAG